jgi:type II secretory pathway component PulK
MVLIIVAIVMALVSLAALGFLVSMKTANRSAHLQADLVQVQQIAASATEFLQTLVDMPRDQRFTWGPLHDNPELFQDVRVDEDPLGQRHGRFCILAPRYAEDSAEPVFHFGVEDLSGRLNLRSLLLWDQQQPGQGRTSLMQLPGMNETVADSILDWIDPDDEPREFGAESEFYGGLDPPRRPPNLIPPRLEDLLAVRGVTQWQMYGREEGRFLIASDTLSGGLSPLLDRAAMRAPSLDQPTSLLDAPPWASFLTVDSGERNESFSGQRRIDLNDPDITALQSALSQVIDPELTRFVLAYRQYGPASISPATAAKEPLPPIAASVSARFRFTSPLDLVDAVVEIPDAGSEPRAKKAYASPIRQESPSSLVKLIEFCDRTTTDPSEVLWAGVNVNTATRPVLLAIPGLTAEQADRIMSARERPAAGATPRTHAVWLLVEGLLNLDEMKQIWPHVTVGGDMYRAQIVAFYDGQSPWYRQDVIVDGTQETTSPIYYRDLRRLGFGFSWHELVAVQETEHPTSLTSTSRPSSPGR